MNQRKRNGHAIGIALVMMGLPGGLAWGGAGDLDPGFGDLGRVTNQAGFAGAARSIVSRGDELILGGGDVYLARTPDPDIRHELLRGFTSRFAANGSLEQTYLSVSGSSRLVEDIVVQDNGRLIGVGRQGRFLSPSSFVAFRLLADGAPDTTYGDGGTVSVPGNRALSEGASVVLDDAGRAVIAGVSAARQLVVIRLQPNGELDPTFAGDGAYIGRTVYYGNYLNLLAYEASPRPQIVRVPGGYRVVLNQLVSTCSVVALHDDGALDTTFGASGYADLNAFVTGASCASMTAYPNGRLMIAGKSENRAFAIRLLANGEQDPDFSGMHAVALMSDATAAALAEDGTVLVAGSSSTHDLGALVVRLQPDGTLDSSFGDAGAAWIDLPYTDGWFVSYTPLVHDIVVQEDGAAMLAGGYRSCCTQGSHGAFAARLLGNSGAAGPGVIGVEQPGISPPAGPGQAVVRIRRRGGSAGAVSVAYGTGVESDAYSPALEGHDYVATSGRLNWSDGETGYRQVVVQLPGDCSDDQRQFQVGLSDVEGGSGLAMQYTTINLSTNRAAIPSTVQLEAASLDVVESHGTISVNVSRDSNASNVACRAAVWLSASDGTATAGSDYQLEGTYINWAAGDSSTKTVEIPIVDDELPESSESFTVRIDTVGDPAIVALGPHSSATITINDDASDGLPQTPGDDTPQTPGDDVPQTPGDDTPQTPGDDVAAAAGGGGGSALSPDSILMLLLVGAVRRMRRRAEIARPAAAAL